MKTQTNLIHRSIRLKPRFDESYPDFAGHTFKIIGLPEHFHQHRDYKIYNPKTKQPATVSQELFDTLLEIVEIVEIEDHTKWPISLTPNLTIFITLSERNQRKIIKMIKPSTTTSVEPTSSGNSNTGNISRIEIVISKRAISHPWKPVSNPS